MCDKAKLVVQRKFPWDICFHLKTPRYVGMWEQQPVTHFHQRKMLFQWFTARGLTNTWSRYKGSCHQDKMRVAVGGPIPASCLLLLLSWLRWLPWKQRGGKTKPFGTTFRKPLHEGLIFICCCLFTLLNRWLAFPRLSFSARVCSSDSPESWIILRSLARSSWRAGQRLADRGKGLYFSLFSFGSQHRWCWSPPPLKNFSKMTPKFFLAEMIIPGKQFVAALIMMTALMEKIIILNGSYSVPCDELVITMKCVRQPKIRGRGFQNWVGNRTK